MSADPVTAVEVRVRYAETDQMGVAHHANYVVWCELARTEYMRSRGISYRALEKSGLRLPVTELDIRYLAPARYEDLVRVRCWVRDVASRKVVFGYAVDLADNQQLLATAQTALIAVDSSHALSTIPRAIRQQLVPTQDPVRM